STGNGKLTYPVGLLTSDEAMLAGGNSGTGNSTYYLYAGEYFWLGSPQYWNSSVVYEFYVATTGRLNNFNVGALSCVRPVVSQKPGAELSGGDGTVSDPYVVHTN
ncbi:MAG: hypothetical protein IKI04_00860, partial [Bacilli bacterium]|nr:hypothetical protein [Bacilli bacterium]